MRSCRGSPPSPQINEGELTRVLSVVRTQIQRRSPSVCREEVRGRYALLLFPFLFLHLSPSLELTSVSSFFLSVEAVCAIALFIQKFEFIAVPHAGESHEGMSKRLLRAKMMITLTPHDVDLVLRRR